VARANLKCLRIAEVDACDLERLPLTLVDGHRESELDWELDPLELKDQLR